MLEYVDNILKAYAEKHRFGPMQVGHFPISDEEIPVRNILLQPFIAERGWADEIRLFDTEYDGRIAARVNFNTEALGGYRSIMVASIYLNRRLNKCWRRFATCKEMYHAMLTNEKFRVTSVEDMRALLGLLANDTTTITGESPQLDSENAAIYLAVETLLPLEFRLHHLPHLEDGSLQVSDIAQMYRVPLHYVQHAFAENYMKNISAKRSVRLEFS